MILLKTIAVIVLSVTFVSIVSTKLGDWFDKLGRRL